CTFSSDFLTVAYDASTGRVLWQRIYDGPDHLRDEATAIAVSPDGSKVFVTGEAWDRARMTTSRRSPTTRPPERRCGPSATTTRVTTPTSRGASPSARTARRWS